MSHFITVVSPHRSTGLALIEHVNERFINTVNFTVDQETKLATVNVWIVDPDSEQGDQLYSRYVKHHDDARRLLVEQMGFDVNLFSMFKFENGSIITKGITQ